MGAWIEILKDLVKWVINIPVAPFVGAWIEIQSVLEGIWSKAVAPFVGAWIEIKGLIPSFKVIDVAPLVGAWIEISAPLSKCPYT